MFSDKKIKKILEKTNLFPSGDLDNFSKDAQKEKKSLEDYLIEKKLISHETLYENIATYIKVPFINLKNTNIRKDILYMVPESVAVSNNVIAFDGDSKSISIALIDPENLEIIDFIKRKTGLSVKVYLSTPENIKESFKKYSRSLEAEFKYLSDGDEEASQLKETSKKKSIKDLPVAKVVDAILEHAIMEGASDIHIEPEEKNVLVRYRLDGILHNAMTLPKEVQSGITSRIKILSNLKVDEHRLPQDGRFKMYSEKYKVSFRVSVIPTFDGEKIVIRILNEKAQILSLDQLGFHERAYSVVKRNIEKPHGIILVTGPTGSGKTTTLYTILNMLNTPEVNISTIEDPIEYKMKNVNQSQINPKIGFTFASGLRSLLRQDPDVIMVGEIRDQETAEIAIHSAMTGHLVLSTIHTNDAPTTIPRLTQMNVPTFLIASTFNIIIAQRLVRKICPNCITSYNLEKAYIKELEKQIDVESILRTLEEEKVISKKKNKLDELLFYRGKGCEKCANTGYKGRLGIYEVLENDEQMADLILKNVGAEKIREYAISKGMLSIVEDGFIKAKNGITTIEEILRVATE